MPDRKPRFPLVREAVASFPSRTAFDRAVAELRAAGFPPEDISVLASHQGVAAAEGEIDAASASLAPEIKYIAPLTVAGIVMISGGPIAAALAALVGAGLGGAAVKELLDGFAAGRHRDEFAAAVEAGALLLWVRVPTPSSSPRRCGSSPKRAAATPTSTLGPARAWRGRHSAIPG
jgi:hypothetical protein